MAVHRTVEELKREMLKIKADFNPLLIDRAVEIQKRALSSVKNIKSEAQNRIIDHNLRVAGYIIELFPDANTLIAALMHNAFNITGISEEEIGESFNPSVLQILKEYQALADISDQTENIIKEKEFINYFISKTRSFSSLFLSFTNRIVMLEDILDNRYKDSIERSRTIAEESIRIFAAIANILGLWKIKALLEDLSFEILHPEEFHNIKTTMEGGVQASDRILKEIGEIISVKLGENNISDFAFSFRKKHLYSIFQKTHKKATELDYLYDINGIRIILNTINECYLTMGIILDNFDDIPNRRKDFISNPKPNGYRSIHLGINYRKYLIEIQIRTKDMDFIAEYGEAAHWVYKNRNTDDTRYRAFFNTLKRQLETLGDDISSDSIDKDKLLNIVHIWTPDRARSFALNRGATPLDFAFCVHTDIGLHCRGAFVNGNYVPLDYELQNGDTVRIIVSQSQKPNIDWFSIIKTNRARKKLTHYFRTLEKEEKIKKGRETVLKEFKKNKLNFNKWIKTEEAKEIFQKLKLDITNTDQLFEQIGQSSYSVNRILNMIADRNEPGQQKEKSTSNVVFENIDDTIVIDGMTDIKYRTAQCCNPIPGDDVIGYITSDHVISIHRKDCINSLNLKNEKLLNVKFIKGVDGYYNFFLHIQTAVDLQIYTKILNIISNDNINIYKSSNIISKNGQEEIREIDLHLKVRDTGQINRIISKICNLQGVAKIIRKASADL